MNWKSVRERPTLNDAKMWFAFIALLGPFFDSRVVMLMFCWWLKAMCMTRARKHTLIWYNKTMCTLQVYSRFNCSFKRIPAFRLLFFLFCFYYYSEERPWFFVVIVLLFILLFQQQQKRHRHLVIIVSVVVVMVTVRRFFFSCNYPSLLLFFLLDNDN